MSKFKEGKFSQLPAARPWYAPHRNEMESIPTPDEIVKSYSLQWYRLKVCETEIILRPGVMEHNDLWAPAVEAPECLLALSGSYLITWWNVSGKACSNQLRSEQAEILDRFLATSKSVPQQVAVISERTRWMEPGVLVNCDIEEAVEVSSALGQNVVVRLEDKGVRVFQIQNLSAGPKIVGEEFVSLEVRTMVDPPCPLSQGPENEMLVKRQGGPGTSRGHEVLAMWNTFAALAHRLVSCSVHSGGITDPEKGTAIALHEIAYPSRFGPMQWLSEKDFSEETKR